LLEAFRDGLENVSRLFVAPTPHIERRNQKYEKEMREKRLQSARLFGQYALRAHREGHTLPMTDDYEHIRADLRHEVSHQVFTADELGLSPNDYGDLLDAIGLEESLAEQARAEAQELSKITGNES